MALETEIKNWVSERKAALVTSYNSKGLKASGQWEQELTETIEVTPNRIKVAIDGARYTEQLIKGRNPNKNQSSLIGFALWAGRSFIKDWIEQKGLSLNPVAVAYNIGKYGIKVPNARNNGRLVEDAFPEESMTNLMNMISAHYKDVIKIELTSK